MGRYKYVSPEEKKAKEEKKLIAKKRNKKFFKIFGFSSLGVAGLAVVAVLVTWITGGFSNKPVYITGLSVEASDQTSVSDSTLVFGNEVLIMGDKTYTTTITFSPQEANQLTLDVVIDEGADILKNPPATVTAGKPFTLAFATDAGGNPKSGKVSLTFKNDTKLAQTTLKLYVDSPLKQLNLNVNDLTANAQGDYPLTVTTLNGTKNSITLSANNNSAYYSPTGFVNYNNAFLQGLNYKKTYIFSSDNTSLKIDENSVDNNSNVTRKWQFLPIGASEGSTQIDTFTHKTFIMQNAFKDEWINAIMSGDLSSFDLAGYNAYINTFINYIATNQEANDFFNAHINAESGLIELPSEVETLKESLTYVFVTNNANFVVSDVKLETIKIENLGQSFERRIFSEQIFDVSTITTNSDSEWDDTHLGVTLKAEESTTEKEEILVSRLKDLYIAPYVKINSEEYINAHNIGDTNTLINGYKKYLALPENSPTAYYKLENSYLQVNKYSENDQTIWKFNALKPISLNDQIYLIAYLDSYYDGEETWAYSNPVSVVVDYTNTSLSFINQSYQIALNDELLNNGEEGNLTWEYKSEQVDIANLNKHNYENMEYKKLLWFIPAVDGYENIITPIADHPIYTKTGEGEDEKINYKVKLATIEGTEFIEYDTADEFYLVGEGESFTLTPQYAIASDSFIPLFAMIMQTTKAEGEGDIVKKTINNNEIANVVVTYTNTPAQVQVTKFLDNIYVYTMDGENFVELSRTGAENSNKAYIGIGESREFYISSIELDSKGNPLEKYSKQEIDTNLIALDNYLKAYSTSSEGRIKWVSNANLNNTLNKESAEIKTGTNYITFTLTLSDNPSLEDSFDITLHIGEEKNINNVYETDATIVPFDRNNNRHKRTINIVIGKEPATQPQE